MPLRSLYEYVSSLTRPIRYMEETRGGESCAADRDATNLVPIHWVPNPPDLIHGGNQGRGELCRRQRRCRPCTDTLVP